MGSLTGDQGYVQGGPGSAEVAQVTEEPLRLEPRLYSAGSGDAGQGGSVPDSSELRAFLKCRTYGAKTRKVSGKMR